MGQKDITEKTLEDYNDIFADIVNVLLFQGKNVKKEAELEKTAQRSQYKADVDDNAIHEQERDTSRLWIKEHVRICFLGLENQTDVDRDIALRTIGYDGAAYRSQLLRQSDGTYSSERYPVITLVLYFGLKHWTQPRTLHERLKIPKLCKKYVQNYKANIFEIAWLTEEQVQQFQSDFKIVADYFVQSRKNHGYVPSRETIRHVDEVLKLMSVLTGDKRFQEAQNSKQPGGVKNMCEVLDQAEERGEKRGEQKTLYRLVKNGLLTLAQASEQSGMDRDTFVAGYEKYLEIKGNL